MAQTNLRVADGSMNVERNPFNAARTRCYLCLIAKIESDLFIVWISARVL